MQTFFFCACMYAIGCIPLSDKTNGQMTDMTLGQLADKTGKNYDTIYRYVRRNFPDIGWTKDTDVPPDIAAVISGKKRGKKAAVKSEGKPEKQPDKEPEGKTEEIVDFAAWRTAAFSWILVCIVIGHAGLIWFDCGVLWGAAGVIGGGMAFLISLAAVLLSFDSNRPRTSGFALSIAFFIDCAAWFVHFPTFKASATHVGDLQTGFISAFMCLFSFAALYMLRDSKLD